MKHAYRVPIPLLLLLIIALFARSAAQDDLIPMPTDESTADLDLTPMFITETPTADLSNITITPHYYRTPNVAYPIR
ncbi:MAG: hypothetical protein MUF87_05200 [Anaerolineae bacterium]|jgi:hypothetical protein|nr:hypothetical protein [Anaerolineae bacterium]